MFVTKNIEQTREKRQLQDEYFIGKENEQHFLSDGNYEAALQQQAENGRVLDMLTNLAKRK